MSQNQGLTKDIWMYLLKSGGRSTVAEIVANVPGLTSSSGHWLIRSMTESGTIRRYERTEENKSASFGVTLDCKVPNMVLLKELA